MLMWCIFAQNIWPWMDKTQDEVELLLHPLDICCCLLRLDLVLNQLIWVQAVNHNLASMHAERDWLISQGMFLRRSLAQQQQQHQAEVAQMQQQLEGLRQGLSHQQSQTQSLQLQQHDAARSQASQSQHHTAVKANLTVKLLHEHYWNRQLSEQVMSLQQQQHDRAASSCQTGLQLVQGARAHQVGC